MHINFYESKHNVTDLQTRNLMPYYFFSFIIKKLQAGWSHPLSSRPIYLLLITWGPNGQVTIPLRLLTSTLWCYQHLLVHCDHAVLITRHVLHGHGEYQTADTLASTCCASFLAPKRNCICMSDISWKTRPSFKSVKQHLFGKNKALNLNGPFLCYEIRPSTGSECPPRTCQSNIPDFATWHYPEDSFIFHLVIDFLVIF